MFRSFTLLTALCGFAGSMLLGMTMAVGQTDEIRASRDWIGGIPEAPTEDWEVGFGGRIYDNWFHALNVDEPETTHPAYPAAGKQKGASTWRCKECHGWDYKGKDGAYAKGSHYSGITGIRGLISADPKRVSAIVRDSTHAITKEMLSDEALERLALFVTRGQHETDWYIDFESRRARGDAAKGERLFQNICAACHGFDGRALNFKTMDNPEYIGTVATENPWETLHKTRNGQPGAPMPAMRVLPVQDAVDILAYCQTLPVK
jgi:mono/diheme cytochrome c family protein